MSILFINGSPNKNGNTAALAKKLLAWSIWAWRPILPRRKIWERRCELPAGSKFRKTILFKRMFI